MDRVRSTSSKYIVRVDGDDPLHDVWEYYFEYGLHLIKRYGIATSPTYLIKGAWKTVKYPQGAGIFYERDKFMEIGGYDESLDHQADLDFYIRYTKRFSIYPSDSLIYLWTPGRSRTRTPEISSARNRILSKYGLKEHDVHHFGAYAYI